jgi:hypothetical protein
MAELSDFGDVLGPNIYDQLFATQDYTGFGDGYGASSNNWYDQVMGAGDLGMVQGEQTGGFKGPWWAADGTDESGNALYGGPSQSALDAFKGYNFNYTPDQDGGGVLNAFDPSGKSYGSFRQKGDDDFTKLMEMVAPAVATWGFGGALSGMFGGGALGGGLGHGLASGSMSSMQGGDFAKGFLGGAVSGGLQGLAAGTPAVMGNNPSAYVPATPGSSLAGAAGITNPTLAGMFNRGTGSALGALASGGSGSDALKSGLTGAALSGLNSVGKMGMNYFKDSLNSWLAPDAAAGGDMEFDALQGSGGDMSEQTDVSPNRYAEFTTGSDGLETYNQDYGFGGDPFSGAFSGDGPQKFAQSAGPSEFSLPSVFGNVGSRVGNFALNNAGDLASMLYGFYNNRRQQKALGQQVSSLQGLYGQNSPYAAQLRNQLNAKAAQSGRRSNIAGRETQLQAQLADRAASMAPTLMQLNQARGQLQNKNMDIALMGLNKMGGFDAIKSGLKGLFNDGTYTGGGYNLSGMQNPYGSDIAFNGWQ